MKRLSSARASRSLAQYAAELDDEIIVLTKGQSAVAALVPLKNVDRESLALSTHPEFMKIIARFRRRFAKGKALEPSEVVSRVAEMGAPNKGMQPPARKARRG